MKFTPRPVIAGMLTATLLVAGGPLLAASAGYAPPRFADADRGERVTAVLPEIDRLYADLAAKEHLPGLVYGVVLDGRLVHVQALGFANLEDRIPAGADTRFRIASMTKSLVVMAALKLRDEGKLSLDDRVEQHLPEFRRAAPLTADSPPITIRHLLTMSSGLPEDNPWADRHIEFTNDELKQLVSAGLSFSNAPGQGYEYSNLGFVLLGRIVTQVAQMRFQDYVTREILQPLGMDHTVWDYSMVPPTQLAQGYVWRKEAWQREPMLHDGDAAAMSGLITTVGDFAKYVAFHQAAHPARDDPEKGPVRRATVREMQQPRIFSGLAADATLLDGKTPNPAVSFYGYGLGWKNDAQGIVKVGHNGGLPGFGSTYRFCPDYGIGVIVLCNLRYGEVYASAPHALDLLIAHAKLGPRVLPASTVLQERSRQVADMVQTWDAARCAAIVADNFFLDSPREDWRDYAARELARIGKVLSVGAVVPENQLRGSFLLQGEKGRLQVRFTLTPEVIPKVQELGLSAIEDGS